MRYITANTQKHWYGSFTPPKKHVYLFLLTGWKKLVRVDCFCGEACGEFFGFWGDCLCMNVLMPPLVLEGDGWEIMPPLPAPETANTLTVTALQAFSWRFYHKWIQGILWHIGLNYLFAERLMPVNHTHIDRCQCWADKLVHPYYKYLFRFSIAGL